jgi:hypothetical protein
MTTPAPIAPRLRKLLLMLSSTQPGEVVAAANAISRTLKDAGRDWHDLAGGLLTTAPQVKPRQRDESRTGADWYSQYLFCRDRTHLLREREAEFVISLGSWRGTPTEKQQAWLDAIYTRLRRS